MVDLAERGGAERPQGPVFTYSRPDHPWFRRTLIRLVERLSGRARFERLYRDWRAGAGQVPGESIFSAGIRALRVTPDLAGGDLSDMPQQGGLLIIANHPMGIVDGLLVGHLASLRRRDVKLMSHSLLCQPPEARDALLPVDFSPGPEARRSSAETRRRAVAWLDAGHVLILFPAGSVATAARPLQARAVDCAWHPFLARLALRPGVVTLPLFIHGQNSRLFQIVSHYSYPLRVALIFFETRRWIGKRVTVSLGAPIAAAQLQAAAPDAGGVVQHLRRITHALAGLDAAAADRVFVWPRRIRW